MSSLDQNQYCSILSPYSYLDGQQEQPPHLISFLPTYVTTPPFTYHTPFYASSQMEEACPYHGFHHQEVQVREHSCPPTGSIDPPPLNSHVSNAAAADGDENGSSRAGTAKHKQAMPLGAAPRSGAGKWMSSKMRLMRRMTSSSDGGSSANKLKRSSKQQPPCPEPPEQGSSSSSSSAGKNNNINTNTNSVMICNDPTTRVCSDCNTTKTPLWRSGPQGPKSLCNACGIRQRKARKAKAESAEASVGGAEQHPADVPYKKRSKFDAPRDQNKLRDLNDSSSALGDDQYPAPQRVFAQDEKEAAILLMALSSGLTLVCN